MSVSSTACKSNAERLITFKTSAVAVCCARDSSRSRVFACTWSNSRTFSMAITAWSANVRTNSIWRSVKLPGRRLATTMTPSTLSLRNSGAANRSGSEPANVTVQHNQDRRGRPRWLRDRRSGERVRPPIADPARADCGAQKLRELRAAGRHWSGPRSCRRYGCRSCRACRQSTRLPKRSTHRTLLAGQTPSG